MRIDQIEDYVKLVEKDEKESSIPIKLGAKNFLALKSSS